MDNPVLSETEIPNDHVELSGGEINKNFHSGEHLYTENQSIHSSNKAKNLMNQFQGNIGEGIALRSATERLGLTPDPAFSQPNRGFDGIYRSQEGNLVLVESKFTEKGIHSLSGDQMQPEWVDRISKRMQNPESSQYTPGNAELGSEIDKIGPQNIKRLVIATDPRTLDAKVYEGQKDGSWQKVNSFSVIDLIQPYLE
jgi:hypothetical protein